MSLGIKKLAAVIGPSLGGMTVLAYCALFPERARSVVSISAAARSAPFSIALRSLQREMIRRDPAWQEGNYSADAIPVQGMRLARKLGMITYRSAKEWALRFGRERASAERKPGDPFGIDFEVESYLENHADQVHRPVRSELLPLHLARDGSVRSRRPRRLGAGRAASASPSSAR